MVSEDTEPSEWRMQAVIDLLRKHSYSSSCRHVAMRGEQQADYRFAVNNSNLFIRGLREPYGKGLVGHCTSGHSLNPPLIIIYHPRSGVVYIFSVVFVCLSAYQTIAFESLEVGSSYMHIRCIYKEYGSR